MTIITVTKRDGRREPLDLEKFHKVVEFACDGLAGVSPSEVEVKSHIQFTAGMKTSDIQETLIKSAAELISEDSPNYQYVAGRLINYHLRKQVYGKYDPDHLFDHYKKVLNLGYYDRNLLEEYSKDEWETLNNFIKHDQDLQLAYVAMEQFRGKYLVQNRVTGEIFETPQMAYMLIAMSLFINYPRDTRIKYVKKYYTHISRQDISLPTPIMAGVRTPQRQFSSCVLIETDDSLDSINATSAAIVKYVSQKAGIGIGGGKIRAVGSPIRSGDTSHTGIIPFFRLFQSAVKSCCLTPETYVEILAKDAVSGRIQIKDLKPGMKVKSYDAETKEIVFLTVEDQWSTEVPVANQRHLIFSNGTELHCSKNHPIMVLKDQGVEQVYPDDLLETDMIISDHEVVHLVSRSGDNRPTNYIDITVANTHVFFASDTEDGPMILTHNSQGGVRGGAATVHYPIWHLEVEDLLVLKNNKGVDSNRLRQMDYSVQFNKLMYERLIEGGNITLFSPSDVPGLYEAFFADQERFKELYEKAERNTRLRKKSISAIDLFGAFMQERKDTGRIYLMNVDHANSHGTYIPEVAPIRQSNLCVSGDTKVNVKVNDELYTVSIDELGGLMLMHDDVLVESYNTETSTTEYKKVEAFAKTNPDAEVLEITDVDSGYSIVCTADHKIFTKNRGYVCASDLTETDELLVRIKQEV